MIKQFEQKHYSVGKPKDEEILHDYIAKQCKLGIVELGILNGERTEVMLKANPNIPIYGIDPIIPDSMNSKLIGDYKKINDLKSKYKNFIFINDYSYNVVNSFNYKFDYIFIDASHIYEDVLNDFNQWFPKLKIGGYVGLHDSACNRKGPYWWEGPSKLADNLILNDDRLEYITTKYTLTMFKKIK